MKKLALLFFILLISPAACAEMAIETSVSRSRVPVGEQFLLDIIVSDAEGRIGAPKIDSLEGFTAYSKGHSQEITIVNGAKSTRSIFTYVLVANDVGAKTVGPFEIEIGGRNFTIAPVEIDVVQGNMPAAPQGPVSAPPQRALPSGDINNADIFVKVWLDKDEVWVNEPVMVTYTLFTRLTSTYKGFEKEPVMTGFWVEDFPPTKTLKRTEQIINNSRYVVADVRKMALFPTQAGVFTIDPGSLSASIEVRDDNAFDSFVSYNIFGSRRVRMPSSFTQVENRTLTADPLTLTVKSLPDSGKPAGFNGAVGQFEIESSLDRSTAVAGEPVTWRVRVRGQGNINTLQTPALPPLEDFKVYDASSSVNISKERLVVEGEKISETVIVPRKAGSFTVPAAAFAYFDPRAGVYRELKTQAHALSVTPSAEAESEPESDAGRGVEPAVKRDLDITKDVRYIHTERRDKSVPAVYWLNKPLYWILSLLLLAASALTAFLSGRQRLEAADTKGQRSRRSHGVARQKLKASAKLLAAQKQEEFYAEISRAVYGYFADKLNVAPQTVDADLIDRRSGGKLPEPLLGRIRTLFDELNGSRFGQIDRSPEEMKRIYGDADRVIIEIEKSRLSWN